MDRSIATAQTHIRTRSQTHTCVCVCLYTYICTYIDVDGTLTAPRKVVTPEMRQFMADLRKKVNEGLVNFVVSCIFKFK